MIVQQRKHNPTAWGRIPFLLLAAVFAFSLLCGNINRVSVPAAAFHDSASALCDLQRDAPAIIEGTGEPSSSEDVLGELLPALSFLAGFGLPAAPLADMPARAIPTPRRADYWGLIPFSLAPPRLA